MRASQKTSTAFHEAGHVAAALKFNLAIRSATIVRRGDSLGEVSHSNPLIGIRLDIDGSTRARMRAERAIIVALAGPSAQKRHAPKLWRKEHGSWDVDTATRLASRINGSPQSTDAYLKWLQVVADEIVISNWKFIEFIASQLIEALSLEQKDIKNLHMKYLLSQQHVAHIKVLDEVDASEDFASGALGRWV